jgi:hypothetical protein
VEYVGHQKKETVEEVPRSPTQHYIIVPGFGGLTATVMEDGGHISEYIAKSSHKP